MDTSALRPEFQQRFEWRARNIEWFIPLIKGGEEQWAQFLSMFDASAYKAYEEGLEDALFIMQKIADISADRSLTIAIDAIKELISKNRRLGDI